MKKISLYITDNYLLTRIATRRYLENDGNFDILGDFASGLKCLEQMKKQTADIVLIDAELNDISAIVATNLIRKNFPSAKVIIHSAFSDENKIIASFINGACGYAIKGENANLKKVINTVVQGGLGIDLEIAKTAFSTLDVNNIKNSEKTYNKRDLKTLLTNRELEVLRLVCEGKTNSQIAKEIIVSINTAKAHVGSILTKLSVNDRVQAAVKAVKANLF